MSAAQIGLVVLGVVLVVSLVSLWFSARLSIRPGRVRAWSTPKDAVGLDYEDVAFQSQDGIDLYGWFVPAPAAKAGRPAPVIVSLHGWPWCRQGTQVKNPLIDLPGSRPVDLMPLTKSFHDAGYSVLMFDLSGYGDSGTRGVVTYGLMECRDVVGAVDYLAMRPDVDASRIGVIGYSQGGATLMFALPQAPRIRAGIAVQPATGKLFTDNYSKDVFKGLATVPNWITSKLYGLAGGPDLALHQPALQGPGARDVPVLFVQGSGDRWGTVADVQRMATMTPRGEMLIPETNHRFSGYTYMVTHPEVALDFFGRHLRGDEPAASKAPASRAKETAPA